MIDYKIHGAKGGGDKPHTPVETPNNLVSVAYAKVLIAVAEGELAGKPTDRDIYLDGTPLVNPDGSSNFGGVKWEWRPGTQDQDYIKGLPEVSTEYNVGVALKATTPWVRSVTKSQLDAVRVTVQFPAVYESKQNGDTVGTTVKYAIDLSTAGGSFVEYGQYDVTGKTNSGYERTHRVELPKSRTGWSVRVRRITPDSTSNTIQNAMNIKSFTEVVDVKQRYPNTALLYVEFDSSTFGGGSIPKISVKTRGRVVRVPSTYNPETRSYSGVWAGDFKWAWTNNPAWVFYDIITQDRFGLGHKVDASMVDKWAMYEVAQYCDVMVDDGTGSGSVEPRHTCNVYIQDANEAYTVLRDLASIFNSMTYWNGNQLVAIADKKEVVTTAPLFSRSNVIDGTFEYAAADDKSIYTSALVSYDDPDNHYNSAVESAFETSEILRWGGDRQLEITAIGCTSRGEAQRRARYALITNMYNRTVTFNTGLQGMSTGVLPGRLINVLDPLIGGRPYTGRVQSATNTVITLDRNVIAKAGDILYLTKKDGTTQGRTIQAVKDNIVTLSTGYTELPTSNTIWYLEASDLKSQTFRVTKVRSAEEGIYSIEAVEYNESKFAAIDNGARLEPRPISVVPPNLQASPKNVKITSNTYVEQTLAVTSLTLSWDQTPNAVAYEAQWRVDDNDWINLGQTGAQQFTVKGVYTGKYLGRVRAINAVGVKSVWATSTLTDVKGKDGKPPALASLTTTGLLFGIRLDWAFKPGSTDTLYTQIRYGETPSFENSQLLGDYAYPTDSHELHGLKAGQLFHFWGRLQDRTGNYGDWLPLSTQAGVVGRTLLNDNGQYNDYFAEMISNTALDKDLYERIELIDGPPTLAGSVNDRIRTVNEFIDKTNKDLDEAVKDIDGALKDLNDKIDTYTDALQYDPKKTYVKGDVVRVGQKLYQASKNVPINTTPPNTNYWDDVGSVIEGYGALVSQVNTNKSDISNLDGKIVASASKLEALTAQYRDDTGEGDLVNAMDTYTNKASIVEERRVRADADGSLSERIITVTAESGQNKANISTLETTVTTKTDALAKRIDKVSADTGDNTSNITKLELAMTNVNEATAKKIDEVAASVTTKANDRMDALVRDETTSRANSEEALAQRLTNLIADRITKEGDRVNAAIRDESTVRVNAEGALSNRITETNGTIVKEGIRLDGVIKTESTVRVNAETALGERIDKLGVSLTKEGERVDAAIQTESSVRVSAEGALGQRIDKVIASVDKEVGDRKTAIAAAVKTESEARASDKEAMGKRVDEVAASVKTETTNRNTAIAAAIKTESEARASDKEAMGKRVDEVIASISTETDNRKSAITAAITEERTVRVGAEEALGKRVDSVEAGNIGMTKVNAAIKVETDARARSEEAIGKRIDSVTATANGNVGTIKTTNEALAKIDGTVRTAWTVKMEAQSNGQYVAAGIGLGIENGPAGLQSQFLVRADRFAVVSGLNGTTSAPFVVANGQVFINDALINKATITNAIIGQTIQSAAWTNWGAPVMTMDFNVGNVICRHPTRTNTYCMMNQDGIIVVVDNVLRVRMGVWA